MAGYVYIITNRKNGALYTGVTTDVPARIVQHREGTGSKFAAEYGISRLVYIEEHDDIRDAIAREKAIKKWRRAWRVELIERTNPDWRDLFYELNGGAVGRPPEMGPRFRGDDVMLGARP